MTDDIPARFLDKWRRLLNLAGELFEVPAALIMRLHPNDLEVLVASQNSDNPYAEQERSSLNTGHYCETVLNTDRELQVVDALDDPDWSVNPDIRLGMIHYLGLPLVWPSGRLFGTLCILDSKPREHALVSRKLLQHFREQIETDFSLIEFEQNLLNTNDQLELLVDQRTSQLRSAIAERERLETALQHAQKMDALAQMAGGVAHDLNNILSGIVSYPDLLLAQLEDDNPLRSALQTIRDSGSRAASVVQNLLAVTRPITRAEEPVNINATVSRYLDSPEWLALWSNCGEVQVELELSPELPSVSSTPADISSCVMNLVVNAIDAMPMGGRLRIATRAEQVTETARPLLTAGDYAVLTVGDNGPGIDAEDQQRIFEPYYSTKKLGRSGTGLGLTMVWNIVEESGGQVFVDSSPQGSVFELFFPATTANPGKTLNETLQLDAAQQNEVVLIVDDEGSQREILSAMLDQLGYTTATAASGEEAVRLASQANYDLLILDMAMPPGISGCESYEQILAMNPSQKAIISSGLLESEEISRAEALGVSSILTKPYTLDELAQAVRKGLTQASPLATNSAAPA